MGRIEGYRQRAEDLERQARRAPSSPQAVELMRLAEAWRSLATEAERLDRKFGGDKDQS